MLIIQVYSKVALTIVIDAKGQVTTKIWSNFRQKEWWCSNSISLKKTIELIVFTQKVHQFWVSVVTIV